MKIKDILHDYISKEFSKYVVKIKPVPEEEGVFTINLFGVPRSDFRNVEDLIFDFVESLSLGDIFIPACFTKEEMIRYYPNIAKEYKALHYSVEAKTWAKALSAFLPNLCQCKEVLNPINIFHPRSQPQSEMIAREHSNTIDTNDSYLRAA